MHLNFKYKIEMYLQGSCFTCNIPKNLPNYKGSPFNDGTIKIVVTSDINCPIQTSYIKYEGSNTHDRFVNVITKQKKSSNLYKSEKCNKKIVF